MQITIAEAAKMAGRTRQAIRKAIEAGKLTSGRDEHGHLTVSAVDVARIWPQRPKPEPSPDQARAEIENRLLRQRVVELAEDRNRWRDQAERVAMLLTDQRERPSAWRQWWSRLSGR